LTKPFVDALAELERHVALANSAAAASEEDVRVVCQTAAMKCFEHCYELAVSLILGELKEQPGEPDASEFRIPWPCSG
jgi:hypothetical protein